MSEPESSHRAEQEDGKGDSFLKRGWLLLTGPRWPKAFPPSVPLARGLIAENGWQIDAPLLPPWAVHEHGERALLPFRHPTFAVRVDVQAKQLAVDQVNKRLALQLDWCDLALSVVTTKVFVQALFIVEADYGDGRRVQQIDTRQVWWARDLHGTPEPDLARLPAVTERILALLDSWGEANTAQTFHALRSFYRACQHDWVDDSYELFCRAAETLLQTGKKSNADTFANRFLQALHDDPMALGRRAYKEHYERRSEIIHGNRFLDENNDSTATIRELEGGVRHLFARFLSEEALFEHVSTMQREAAAARERIRASRSDKR